MLGIIAENCAKLKGKKKQIYYRVVLNTKTQRKIAKFTMTQNSIAVPDSIGNDEIKRKTNDILSIKI